MAAMRIYRAMRGICFGLLAALVAMTSGGLADTLTGTARGRVLYVLGRGAIPNVLVTITSVERGWQKQTLTDSEGYYVFLQLEPGIYTLTARHEDYQDGALRSVLIRLNDPRVIVPD